MGPLALLWICVLYPKACVSHEQNLEFSIFPTLVADLINISISVFITLAILRSGIFENGQPLLW